MLLLLTAALLWVGGATFRAVFLCPALGGVLSGPVDAGGGTGLCPGPDRGADQPGAGALKEQQLRRRYGDLMPWGVKEPVTSLHGGGEPSAHLPGPEQVRLRASVFRGPGVAPRPGAGPGASYTLSGGQTFQKELTGGVYELVRPKAETVGTVYADLDGDGSDETVRLCVEETVEPDGAGSPGHQ